MKKNYLLAIFLLALSFNTYSEGWTTTSKITSVGQYGQKAIYFTMEHDISACDDKKKLYFLTDDASNPENLYSTLLAAFVSGKRMKVYLHDPVTCGGEHAQRINTPNYFYIQD